uniref:Uncharacterized protein n=1 Tax=Nelumbo nucifera TaxID=4432 RepID=A0A822ZSI6_NELNU|nr:TPA_asm: hypothetical protein HUJ06_017784 [Nelumbo nucifera]
MSFTSPSICSGSRATTTRKTFEFGRTHVVRPKGKHQATYYSLATWLKVLLLCFTRKAAT